jgi:hypothetical protein
MKGFTRLRGVVVGVAAAACMTSMFAATASAKYVTNAAGADVHVTSALGYYDGPYIGWLAQGQGFSVTQTLSSSWAYGLAGGEVNKYGNVLFADLNPSENGATFHNETATCATNHFWRNYTTDTFATDTGITFPTGSTITVRDATQYHYRLYGTRAVRVYMANRWGFMSANCLSGGFSN